jgi:hypothetical protein
MGNMYFRNAAYLVASKILRQYISELDLKTREFIHIEKIRKDLDEVILYEAIASRNDSILHVVSMSEVEVNYLKTILTP